MRISVPVLSTLPVIFSLAFSVSAYAREDGAVKASCVAYIEGGLVLAPNDLKDALKAKGFTLTEDESAARVSVSIPKVEQGDRSNYLDQSAYKYTASMSMKDLKTAEHLVVEGVDSMDDGSPVDVVKWWTIGVKPEKAMRRLLDNIQRCE